MRNLSFSWKVCIGTLGLFLAVNQLVVWLVQFGSIIALIPGLAAGMAAIWIMHVLIHKRDVQIADRVMRTARQLTSISATADLSRPESEATTLPVTALEQLATDVAQKLQQLRTSNQRLKESDARLQSILASMSEGVLLIDRNTRVLYANAFAGRLLDRKATDLQGRQLWEVVRNAEFQSAVELADAGEDVRREFEIHRTRSVIEVSVGKIEVSGESALVIVLHDVTQLRRLEKLRREFVSNVSHELKTPLTAIQAYADTLLEGALTDPEISTVFLNQIIDQANRLQELIQDMLRLARIEAQADVFQMQPVSISQTLESCVDARQTIARSREIILTYEQDAHGDVGVIADEQGLRTIFENLINNALNYTSAGGSVQVRCRVENGSAVVDVQDDGIGIAREHHDRIFERFYRVDKARGRGIGGTGLGLAIVKHCVSAFHGQIELESTVGQGTCFRVSIPLVSVLEIAPVTIN